MRRTRRGRWCGTSVLYAEQAVSNPKEPRSMTDLYAVIGNPVGHSKSPLIHLAFAKQTGQDIDYVPLEAPVDGFNAKVDELRQRGGRGLNITTPFKLDAFAYATELSEPAKLAGAVNCLKFEGARVVGQNYDGV